jgi:hypothetical protein
LGREAERDIERTVLELRLKSMERAIQSYKMLLESTEQGGTEEAEYHHMIAKLTIERFPLEQALFERTSLGKRKERKQVV